MFPVSTFPPRRLTAARPPTNIEVGARDPQTGECHAASSSRAIIATLFIPVDARAQDAIAPKTLAAIKRATVFVKVEAPGHSVSGSGFLITADADSALAVTNYHVIEPRTDLLPRATKDKGLPFVHAPGMSPRSLLVMIEKTTVAVVLDSGTKAERSAKAEVGAIDPERDLAVLRLTGLKDLPEPIDVARVAELAETLPVYTFGYVFTGLHTDPRIGVKAMVLLPVAGGSYFGRFPAEPFAIIAATDAVPSGCLIVLPRDAFDKLSTHPFAKVQVVK